MSLSLYQYVCIFLALYLLRQLLRTILALRFHFQFRRIGFFSISDIQYHHHRSSETALWSITAGKLKIRIRRRPRLSSTTASALPFITIHVTDVHVQLHSLAALAERKKQKRPVSPLNRRISRMSSSLTHIPWWYSLSFVKAFLKFVSALPAQFLMAGLANYVDFQMDNFTMSIEKDVRFHVQHTNFSSVLFAAVNLPSPSNNRGKRTLSLHASHQRHSIKRAQHLFKEKFLEIVINTGPISLVFLETTATTSETISLPSGIHIAVSCHLSAGCVTLKDVDANAIIETIKVNADSLLKIMNNFKRTRTSTALDDPTTTTTATAIKEDKRSMLVRLLHYVSISVGDTIIETNHQEDCSSALCIKEVSGTATMENDTIGIDPYIKMHYATGLISWTITDKSLPITKTRQIEVIIVPTVTVQVTMSQSVMAKKTYGDLDTLSTSFTSDELIPNRKYISVSVNANQPKVFLDISKSDTLQKIFSSLKRDHGTLDVPSPASASTVKHSKKQFNNLPRTSLNITVEYPSVYFRCVEKSVGLLSWSELSLDTSGTYIAERSRPASVISSLSEPSVTCDSAPSGENKIEISLDSNLAQRLHSPTRPSWTNLFRRSWRSKESGIDYQQSSGVEWRYKTKTRLVIQHTCIDTLAKKAGDQPLVSIKDIELLFSTNSNVSFIDQVDTQHQVQVLWDPSVQHQEIEFTIEKPMLNLWSKTETGNSQLDFWINNIFKEIKQKIPSKGVSQPPSNNNNDRRQRLYKYLLTTKIQFELNSAVIVLKGVDQSLKGKREVPVGYIDNTPEKDIGVYLTLTFDRLFAVFIGSHISDAKRQSHRYSASLGSINSIHTSDGEADTDREEQSLGSFRFSAHEIAIKDSFELSSTDCQLLEEKKESVLLWISHLNLRTSIMRSKQIIVAAPSMVIKKIGVQYSIASHYALLVILISTKQVVRNITQQQDRHSSTMEKKRSVLLRRFQFQVNRTDFHTVMPGGAQLYTRVDGLRTEWSSELQKRGEVPSTAIRNITVYGVSPQGEGQWDQLLEMDGVSLSVEKDVDTPSKVHQLSMLKFYLRIPYKYELCHVLDDTVNLIKSIKAMHSRLLKNIPFLYFGPTEKKEPMLIPNIQLNCELLTFQFEDDPFEVRLRSIWKTGVIEQTNRLALNDAFDLKAMTLTKHQSNENSEGDTDADTTNEDNDARVSEAWKGLQQHNSRSWKKHIDAAISKEVNAYEQIRGVDYRSSIFPEQMDGVTDDNIQGYSDIFHISIVRLPRCSPLLDLTIRNTSLLFQHPEFELEKTREFIHDLGKGQPIDTPLSTLIPFHLTWKSGETWAQIRDYPIPFVLVPPNDAQNQDEYSWSLSGNYVLADALGDLDATRSIKIPIISTSSSQTVYSIIIPRTSTPLKFFSVVNINVHTPGLSYICWCVPYQPAIQDITRVFETFTKPPVDPSEKVGFWDKIRLIIHTRTNISFTGGGDLAVVMKGSRNPYEMSEKGFGLAKVWRKNVVWLIGHENPEGDFMQIISHDYAFGVPDLVNGGFTAPYILPTHMDRSHDRQSTTSSLSSSLEINDRNPEGKDSCFVKIALKMSDGIRMGLGCHLERACNCDICDEHNDVPADIREAHKRTLLNFLPHYKVKMKAADNVHEEDYDAYRGFRSDYIHFSISIVKLSSNDSEKETPKVVGNSMHISPGFVDHFVSWVRLFGGAMSYPLRSGPLFPKLDKRPTKKFGKHMSTLKYKIVINPLTIGLFMKDENMSFEETTVQDLGDCVGLKGFVRGFSLDIHQRREIINISNYKLDQKRLKANWPIHEAEVQLKNIDIRVVKAQYMTDDKETSPADNINQSTESSADDLHGLGCENDGDVPDMMEGLNYQGSSDPESSEWVDLDDFIELNVVTPSVLPSVQVLPFAYSPYIYYIRQTNRDDAQRYRYLHETHDCILGTAINTREMQIKLLQDRKMNIDIQIRKHQARLHTNEMKKRQPGADEKALDELSDQIVEKTRVLYEKRELLQRYIRDISTQMMPGIDHSKTTNGYSNLSVFAEDYLKQWEEHLGYFKVRCIAHNPQILWNNSVRNIVYHALDLREHRRALTYYTTSRTVKFLRDLIDAHYTQQIRHSDHFVLDNDDGGLDSSMVHDLITKLLSEKDTKLYAPNETEEEGELEFDQIDMSKSENINNPEMQVKSIPSDYIMKSSYLIDLLNPQISLQSDCDPDNIVLAANERIQVKGFNIIDENEPDVEMESIKHRTVASLDNLQFFVAKKEQFDSVDLLLDNHYGAKENDHWLAWIPPEMLVSYVKTSDQFQRIGSRISATLQYDKYNPLRLRTTSSVFSRIHPFEERCDSVQLNFPQLQLTVDSSQYNAIYQVATDLLLYKEPAKQERLARLREIMMAADRSSLVETTEKIVDLQNRVRQLTYARDQYRQNIALLDNKRMEEFKSIKLALYDTLEELYLGMEAIKLMQSNQRKDFNEPKTNLKLVCSMEKVIWELILNNQVPLCECTLINANYIFINKEDHSATNTFEVDIVQVKNTSPSPVFADVLGPYFDPRKPYDFSRHKMLRCYVVTLPPVGGIPIVQHLETNLHPLRVQMTYNFGKALAYYLFPPEKRQKQQQQQQQQQQPEQSSTLPSTSSVPAMAGSDSSIQYEIPQLAASSITLPVTANDKDTVKSVSSSKSTESAPAAISNNDDHAAPTRDDSELSISAENMGTTSKQSKKQKKQQLQKETKSKASDDLMVMKKRASSNRTFILVKIPGTRHCLSYQGPKEKNIEDLRDFAFEQPTLEFRNQTWSWFELMSNVKRDFMKAALRHNSTALLREKLLRRHPREFGTHSDISIQSSSVNGSKYFVPQSTRIKDDDENKNHFDNSGASSDEDEEVDTVSLHSGNSHEMWETEASEPRHTHIWSRLKRSKKSSPSSSDANEKRSTLDTNRRLSTESRDTVFKSSSTLLTRTLSNSTQREDEQLIVKGKHLLGKYYNGPTQWTGTRLKGRSAFISNLKK